MTRAYRTETKRARSDGGQATLHGTEVGVRRLLSAVVCASLLLSCDFSASTKVLADTGDTATSGAESGLAPGDGGGSGGSDGSGGAESGGSGSGGDSGGAEGTDPGSLDEDGDGVTVEDGDCDDGDPSIYPGAEDLCDQRDEDCDGEVDEDARYLDEYEDNDSTPTDLGDLSGGGSVSLDAWLDSSDDVDRFTMQTDDSSFSLWDMTIRLSNIPDGLTWTLRVMQPTGEVHETTGMGALTIERSDEAFVDDAGTWEVVVEAVDEGSCETPYLLTIDFSG